jgi:hypothetical protein
MKTALEYNAFVPKLADFNIGTWHCAQKIPVHILLMMLGLSGYGGTVLTIPDSMHGSTVPGPYISS